MKPHLVFINIGNDSFEWSVLADSPRDAALKGCIKYAMVRKISSTRAILNKGLHKKDYNGVGFNIKGACVEVVDNLGKHYYFEQTNL